MRVINIGEGVSGRGVLKRKKRKKEERFKSDIHVGTRRVCARPFDSHLILTAVARLVFDSRPLPFIPVFVRRAVHDG